MAKAFAIVRKLRLAAKACFTEKDKQAMKDFHVGKVISSVKEMVSEIAYLKGVVAKCAEELSGFKAVDVETMVALAKELSEADVTQENGRKAKKVATAERDKALSDLETAVRKVRNAAKSVFGDNKTVMIEFESIIPARRASVKSGAPA